MNIIDSIDLDSRDGFDLRAEIVPDDAYYSEPDGDYSDEQIAAFRNGDWGYVGIITTMNGGTVDAWQPTADDAEHNSTQTGVNPPE